MSEERELPPVGSVLGGVQMVEPAPGSTKSQSPVEVDTALSGTSFKMKFDERAREPGATDTLVSNLTRYSVSYELGHGFNGVLDASVYLSCQIDAVCLRCAVQLHGPCVAVVRAVLRQVGSAAPRGADVPDFRPAS